MARSRTGEKDSRIIDAAIGLFLKRGVRGTTIQNIATESGVAVGTVYVYYKDKASIVKSVAHSFAEKHDAFANEVLCTRRKPQRKLLDYMLGFYDMWLPFGSNTQGALELAEAVIKNAPETLGIAQDRFLKTIELILGEGKESGLLIEDPMADAKWIAMSTLAFFPLAGTPSIHPLRRALERDDLAGLLAWILEKYENK